MEEAMMTGTCPVSSLVHKQILLGHGSGGKLTHELIEKLFRPALLPPGEEALNDATVFTVGASRLCLTTDSFVVDPLFFPGGDIGKLAVHGTINDLAVTGARPMVLSAAFILEEGLAMHELERIVSSMKAACEEAGVAIITGDTKVVNRGKCDKVFITTAGVGVIDHPGVCIAANNAQVGDVVIINGDIAAHGMAIMSARGEFEFETPILSDTAPLHTLVKAVLDSGASVHCMRDLTRGGLASALNELAAASAVGIEIEEEQISMQEEVKGACEILGLEPLHVANEGKLIAIVAPQDAQRVLQAMQSNQYGRQASCIGHVVAERPGLVTMKTPIGGQRIIPMLAGEQLPRIC